VVQFHLELRQLPETLVLLELLEHL
jgi:hypothetical protein